MLMLIVEAIAVITSSWLFTKKYFNLRQLSELILIWFILFFAQIVLVELSLGIIGKLYLGNVVLAHIAILILAFCFCYDKKTLFFLKPDIEPFTKSKLLLLALSIFTAFFSVKFFVNLINPPMCPDGMQQHLAFPAAWIISGNLDIPFQIFGALPFLDHNALETSSGSYYPINAQLFFAWFMLPLRNAFLADVGEAPFYIIGLIGVYSILRKYNVNSKIAWLSGFLWVLIPNIFKQLRNGSQIDVICAVIFILVVNTLLLLKQNFTFRNAILFGVSIGLFVGTKVINFIWLAALMPLICYVLYNEVKANKFSLNKIIRLFGAIVSMVILFSGFMYIKNYIFTGNPLFPYNLKVFGKTIFHGLLAGKAYKMQVAPWEFNFMRTIFREGLGVQFLTIILPGTFIPLIFYKYFKAKVSASKEYLCLFAAPLIMLILYVFSINIYTVRYFFPYLTLGLLTGIIFISKLPQGGKYLYIVSFVSIIAAAFELANGYELVTSLILSLLFFAILLVNIRKLAEFYNGKIFGKFMIAVILAGFLFFVYFNNKYDKEEFDRYPLSFSKKESAQRDIGKGWKALNELTKEGSRVAYTGRQEFYPFYGSKLKNYVKYVSVNEKDDTPYNNPDGFYRKIKVFSAWRENLRKERIEYLFVALPFVINREQEDPNRFPIEDEWAVAHPDEFRLVFSNTLCHIYKVIIENE